MSHIFFSFLTHSSSNSWSECSDIVHPLPPRLYGRLLPTPATLEALQQSGQKIIDIFDSTRIRYPPAPVTDFTDYLHISASNSMAKHSTSQSGEQSQQQQLPESSDSVDEKKRSETPSLASPYDFPFCCERSWVSHSFLLPPGEYLLFVATEEQKSSINSSSRSSSSHPLPTASASNHHQPNQHPHPKSSAVPRNSSTVTGNSTSSVFHENQEVENGIWCHLTSTGCIGLHSQASEEEATKGQTEIETKESGLNAVEMGTYFQEMKTKYSLPLPEVWPLLMDHQQEVSSKGLIRLLTQIRSEVNRVNIDFLEIKSKESKNKLLVNRIPL